MERKKSDVDALVGIRREYMPTYEDLDWQLYRRAGPWIGLVINMPMVMFLVPVLLLLMVSAVVSYIHRSAFVSLLLSELFPTWIFGERLSLVNFRVPHMCGPFDYRLDERLFGKSGVTCPSFLRL